MLYRYDISDKLDLSRFKKQAPSLIGKMRELTYEFYLDDYKLVAEITTTDSFNNQLITLYFFDITKDDNDNVVSEKIIVPLESLLFKNINFIKSLFINNNYKAYIDSDNVDKTTDIISTIVKLLFKINSLKAFI